MVKFCFLFQLFFILSADRISAKTSIQVNPEFGKITDHCKSDSSSRHVWIVKQWHLGSSVNTKAKNDVQVLPQEKNQTAIYKQLEVWVRNKEIKEIYAEGCSGELTSSSVIFFNGWSVGDLKKVTSQPRYPQILTSVPLKIEAKFGAAVRTLCGDDLQLIKENGLAFSDARGALGFLSRIEQYKNDSVRVKGYLDGVIELYKLPASTTSAQAIERLKIELKLAINRAKEALEKRNLKVAQLVMSSKENDVVVVYGGLHSSGLLKAFDKAGIGCSIVEPVGYQDDEMKLLQKLEDAVKSI